jgi:hypothetical protein
MHTWTWHVQAARMRHMEAHMVCAAGEHRRSTNAQTQRTLAIQFITWHIRCVRIAARHAVNRRALRSQLPAKRFVIWPMPDYMHAKLLFGEIGHGCLPLQRSSEPSGTYCLCALQARVRSYRETASRTRGGLMTVPLTHLLGCHCSSVCCSQPGTCH